MSAQTVEPAQGPEWTPEEAKASLEGWILGPDFPCLGARSAVRGSRVTMRLFDGLGTVSAAKGLVRELAGFAATVDPDAGFASFIAGFTGPPITSEKQFETLLWRQLRLVHAFDTQAWNPQVASDPASQHFSFSVAGTAFFVVGMHPGASRLAHQAQLPVLAFNLHSQFQRLRDEGRFEGFRDTIRRRDVKLQGSVNPMLANHGEITEARQYSGRAVEDDWAAPFLP